MTDERQMTIDQVEGLMPEGGEKATSMSRCDQGRHGPWKTDQMDNWGAWDRQTCQNCGYYEDNGHPGQFSRPFRKPRNGGDRFSDDDA